MQEADRSKHLPDYLKTDDMEKQKVKMMRSGNGNVASAHKLCIALVFLMCVGMHATLLHRPITHIPHRSHHLLGGHPCGGGQLTMGPPTPGLKWVFKTK